MSEGFYSKVFKRFYPYGSFWYCLHCEKITLAENLTNNDEDGIGCPHCGATELDLWRTGRKAAKKTGLIE